MWLWQAATVTAVQAVRAPHSGDWLNALPLSACGLRLDDNTIHIAVGLRLGANIYEPHQCPCGVMTDAKGLHAGVHGLSCRGGTGRSARHHNLNDLVWRALGKANIPSVKEPTGLFRSDGKRPDGLSRLTLIPWKNIKCVTWDVTVTDTLAQSYLSSTSSASDGTAEATADRKSLKYT